MTAETLIIVLIRLVVPLSILRWPFFGGVLSFVADALDIVLASLIDLGGLWNYHALDKYLDTYYLALEFIVAQRWEALERGVASVLFVYRLIGVVIFEITGARAVLFFFPSLFENFFLFNAGRLQFLPQYVLTPPRLAVWLVVLLIPKMVQEYFIHYQRALDDVVAVDVIEDVSRKVLDWFADRFR
jgi:hypothetical protein